MRRIRYSCICVSLALCIPSMASGKEKLAVIDFQVLGSVSEKDTGQIAAEYLIGQLSDKYAVHERAQIARLLAEHKLEAKDLIDQTDKAIEFGKMKGIHFLILGSVGKLGNNYIISGRLVDCNTAQVGTRSSVASKGLDSMPDALNQLLTEMGLSKQWEREEQARRDAEAARAAEQNVRLQRHTVQSTPPPAVKKASHLRISVRHDLGKHITIKDFRLSVDGRQVTGYPNPVSGKDTQAYDAQVPPGRHEMKVSYRYRWHNNAVTTRYGDSSGWRESSVDPKAPMTHTVDVPAGGTTDLRVRLDFKPGNLFKTAAPWIYWQ